MSRKTERRRDVGPDSPSTQTLDGVTPLPRPATTVLEEFTLSGHEHIDFLDEGSWIQSGQTTMEAGRQSGLLAVVPCCKAGQAGRAMEAESADP